MRSNYWTRVRSTLAWDCRVGKLLLIYHASFHWRGSWVYAVLGMLGGGMLLTIIEDMLEPSAAKDKSP